MDRRVSPGAALLLCLLAATLVTAVLVVRARTPDLVLEVTEPTIADPAEFDPAGPPPNEVPITFFVRESDGDATVGIVDSHEDLVRTLDGDVALVEDGPSPTPGTGAPTTATSPRRGATASWSSCRARTGR